MRRIIGLVVSTAAIALVVQVQVASAAVGVGHSGWSWGNPLPQGEQIESLDFVGNTGYAAGKFGTLIRTSDAGATWVGIPTGITQDLAQVSIIDADSLAIAGGCSVRRSDNSGQTFTRLPWTASDAKCSASVASLDFPADQVGFLLLSNGSVLSTSDGGRSWSRKTALPGTKAAGGSAVPTDIAFISTTTGVATTTQGRIYRTTDGGQSWTLVLSHSQALNGLFFASPLIGYAVGSKSGVFKTTDGGASWSEKANGTLDFTGIRCAAIDQCMITNSSGDRVVITAQDAAPGDGLTFTSVTPSSDKIYAAAFASATRAVAAGAFGTTVLSNDGGINWSGIGSRLTSTYSRIRAASKDVAYVAGDSGAAAKTTNGGKTWVNIAGPTGNDVIDLAFPTATTGYALDDAGGVSRTDNGGTSWQILNPGTSADPQAIVAPSVNRVLLIGPRGVVRSSDGGNQFSRVRGRTVSKSKLFDADLAGSSIFAYGAKVILRSTNGGRRWRRVRMPRKTAIASLDFVTRKVGYALGQNGRVWKTKNGGKRWSDVIGVGSDYGNSLAFSNTRKGYLVVSRFGGNYDNGYVLRTSNGGKTWTPELVSDERVMSIGATAGTDYTLAGSNSLLYTNSGGLQGASTKVSIKTKRKRVKRRSTIKVSGKVSGAQQGETVVVSRRYRSESGWDSTTATIASNGTFTTTWKVSKPSYFVAQFAGNADHAGKGSKVLSVRTKGRR